MNSANQKNRHKVYLLIVSKEKAGSYKQASMPSHYDGTIRDESRLAYATLAQLLESQFSMSFDVSAIHVTADGKPYHKDNQYFFSLAHSDRYIACALGFSEMGVDIEDSKDVSQKIHTKFMTETEIIERVDPLVTWVTKEAYSKLRGIGLRLSFNKHSAAEMRDEYLHTIQLGEDYICALFCTNTEAEITVEVIT